MDMWRNIRATVRRYGYRFLDRVDRQKRALSVAGSVYLTYRTRQPCRLEYDDGVWLHHFPDAVLADTRIRESASTFEQYRRATRDVFFYEYVPKAGDIVVDVGAGVGSETLTSARLVGDGGHVYAIEAHPVTFACLQKMCARNELSNTTPLHLAITDHEGTIRLSDDQSKHIANTILEEGGSGVEVPAQTLDHLVERLGIDRIDFLKINIEGAEKPLVRGAEEAFRMTRHAAISCHDFAADKLGIEGMRTRAVVEDFLHEQGFGIVTRPDDPRAWVRDTLYAFRPD